MMKRIEITQDNVDTVFATGESAYYTVRESVSMTGDIVTVPKGSILDFRGGSLGSAESCHIVRVDLNGADVLASSSCVFRRYVEVTGFSNSLVRAEWFNDRSAGMEEHEAINKALVSAYGCPVTLEYRYYDLRGSIMFPPCADGKTGQTLISPGILRISKSDGSHDYDWIDSDDPYAYNCIVVNTSNIHLVLNTIQCTYSHPTCGIRLTGHSCNVKIEVDKILYCVKGIDVSTHGGSNESIQIQNCQVNFQYIHAESCIYVNLFAGKSPSSADWFTESLIVGGMMQGTNGVFFADSPNGVISNNERINGLVFQNIGLEGLNGIPLRLRNMCMSKFVDLRMSESLPNGVDAVWVDLKNVFDLSISIKSGLLASRFQADDSVKRVTVNAYFRDEASLYYSWHFDRLIFQTLQDSSSTGMATCSIQPYNSCRTIIADKTALPTGMAETVYNFADMFPVNDGTYEDRLSRFDILPETVNAVVRQGNDLILDFTGFNRFLNPIVNICANIAIGGMLTVRTSESPDNVISMVDSVGKPVKSVSFSTSGLYRCICSEQWQLVITRVGQNIQ